METKLKCFKCGDHCEDAMTFCGGSRPFKNPGPLCESCWQLPQADLDAACDAFVGRASAPVQEIQECGCHPGTAHGCEPPQPAPMTRAARVLAKMERDPYLSGHGDEAVRVMTDGHRPNETARLRLAKIRLDRPLEADMRRWERLTCEVHPVTCRPVRGRR